MIVFVLFLIILLKMTFETKWVKPSLRNSPLCFSVNFPQKQIQTRTQLCTVEKIIGNFSKTRKPYELNREGNRAQAFPQQSYGCARGRRTPSLSSPCPALVLRPHAQPPPFLSSPGGEEQDPSGETRDVRLSFSHPRCISHLSLRVVKG